MQVNLVLGLIALGWLIPAGAATVPTPEELAQAAPGLGLTEAQVDSLNLQLATTKPPAVGIACLTAQLALGEEQVDVRPLNEALVNGYWSEACIATPYCIIQPQFTKDVALAIKIVSLFQTRFAVRSGGHSPNPGWSGVGDSGVLIDLGRLNSISVSRREGKPIVSIGPGARWGEVYESLDGQQATVIGGRIPNVGVGGLILGGGYYHTSPSFGLAADNVQNFEVVTATGVIINANSTHNSDLFWALKGGGPNFGVVTRFDLNTIEEDQIWGQINIYTPDQALEVLDAFGEWQSNGASDSNSNIALSIGLDAITVGLIYAKPTIQPAVFSPFYNLTPLASVVPPSNLTHAQISQIMGAAIPNSAGRHDYRAFSSRVNTELTKKMYSFWLERALAVRASTGAVQTFSLQHVGESLREYGEARGGNALGLPAGTHQWWTTLVDWQDAADDDLVRSVSIETTTQWAKSAIAADSGLQFLYLNDASRDQSPLVGYGGGNIVRLQRVAAKYDPKRLFQTLQNGGFLLSKA
ncbi:hypothetical protein B0I35DRAFT_449921 [Stachybotrys elegans]|uniref:FAD-binding PCMH-type domain-containing protein n=1 Tax=Stachybotrys elegans TaxID=80388 RepID=A0A8K0SV60_9HYPO|nr:hypothetical protein B0I35DRAFT_449921 [Stachybotrys elegans]